MRVVLAPWSAEWAGAFARDVELLTPLLGATLVALHHVGSTSVAGLTAKPIVDVLGEVASLDALDRRRAAFEDAQWLWFGEYGIPRRRYVKRVARPGTESLWPTDRTHVHFFRAGDPEVTRHLVFRDALRADTTLRDSYAALKCELQRRFLGDRDAYTDAKTDFVERVIAARGGPARA